MTNDELRVANENKFEFEIRHSKFGSGSGSHTHLKKFMRLLSVLWSSFPQLKLVESVGNAPT